MTEQQSQGPVGPLATSRTNDTRGLAPWMDDASFPLAPGSATHGYRRHKGKKEDIPCSPETLERELSRDPMNLYGLVWSPEQKRMLPPATFASLREFVRTTQLVLARRLFRSTAITFFGVAAISIGDFFFFWHGLNLFERVMTISLIFAALYTLLEMSRELARARTFSDDFVGDLVRETRYAAWMSLRRPFWRFAGPAAITAVWFLQGALYSRTGSHEFSWLAAGLIKHLVGEGQWWRLLTAPFLHATGWHWLCNAFSLYALLILEQSSPKGTAPLVLLAGFIVGCAFSVLLSASDSIGASGGVYALIGYTLVFNCINRTALTAIFIRPLLVSIATQFFFGLILAQYIDNAAHLGGLLAGIALAFAINRSDWRPTFLTPHVAWLGRISAAILLSGLLLTLTLLIPGLASS